MELKHRVDEAGPFAWDNGDYITFRGFYKV